MHWIDNKLLERLNVILRGCVGGECSLDSDYVKTLNCYWQSLKNKGALAMVAWFLRNATPQHKLDAAYCYRPSSVVYRSVCLSVGLSVTAVSPAKTDEPIEMPFGIRTRAGPMSHVLVGVHTGATWWIPLNRQCGAEMRPVVKLLWPLFIIVIFQQFEPP